MGEWGVPPNYSEEQKKGMQARVDMIKAKDTPRGGMSQEQIAAAEVAIQASIDQVRASIGADPLKDSRVAAAHSDQMDQAAVKGQGVTNSQVERQKGLTGKALKDESGQ